MPASVGFGAHRLFTPPIALSCLSAPHFGPPTPTEDFRPKLGTLFTIGKPEANMRAQGHGLREKSMVHREKRRRAVRITDKQGIPKTAELALWHYSLPNHRSTQGPPGSRNELQMTFRNSTWSPKGRFSGHKRLPTSLRGTSTENRDHNDPRAPRDNQGTPRKPRSQVPRSSRANGLRLGATSQRSPTR
ncbi:hypothetical protein CRG98_012369 [Punica granatum]|uniref:Uncharacterized protein n=1 Tax=Punica granatum TaxID=22663 RepID=A0A2I0KFG2_PUNGR|nr:hypothetical protein CRG98_012369 [Punica granatum]